MWLERLSSLALLHIHRHSAPFGCSYRQL
jgi:hypothetical protein